jgi:putative membrane protein
MKLTIALATACALLSAPAFAQAQTAPSTTGATIGTVPARYLVPQVIMANMFDVQLARLAEQKGDSADKTFVQQDMPVHAKATNELKMLVTNGKVNISIPSALDSEQQQKLGLLQKLSGKQFDKAFRDDEAQSRWYEIYLVEQYAKSGDNADLKNWASINLPTLRDHLNKAEKLS